MSVQHDHYLKGCGCAFCENAPERAAERRSQSISAGPWHTGGIFNPNSDDPRVWIWTPVPAGAQSGEVVAKDVRPRDAQLICAASELLSLLREAENLAVLGDIEEDTEALGWGEWLKNTRALLARVKP
jgi:hypothetical protein